MKKLSKISRNLTDSNQVSFIEVDENAAGQRIDNFLIRVNRGVPKSHMYRILRSGEVRVNKRRVDARYRLVFGDVVRLPPIQMTRVSKYSITAAAAPTTTQFNILFEDDYLLVINKPAGIAVHGGSGIAFGVIEQMRETRPNAKFLELVHRLDRETSGILMLAKKRSVLVELHEQIRNNHVKKWYYACVHGQWTKVLRRRKVIKEPLHKYLTAEGERRVRVQANGLTSHTILNLVDHWLEYALVEAELRTGRMHQIRVHLAHLGLPIVGDTKYGNFALNKILTHTTTQPSLKRMFLHAHCLKLVHPYTGNFLQFDAPLPAECQQFLNQLRDMSTYANPRILA